ncbi:BTAD domain-containing putative transcriptional regulator [Pseudonocardia sp. GCM10023141]|uniref:BTAD domain-containing putative transcriptional regulator n=1 Tax=Pseudonocardia sp. GCM10023141 TaxID=3252653 RepID=UPI00361B35AB
MRIGLLGAVEAWPDAAGGAPVALGGSRLRGLLARLALDAGRPVGATVLVDDLWGHAPPESSTNALQALVSRLRRALGSALVATVPHGYRLTLDPDAVDALRFGSLVSAAERQADPAAALEMLRSGLALWRGPALADLSDVPFAAAVTARLAERRATAVEHTARLALQLGDAGSELDALAEQLAAAPLRESTAALYARSLHAAGRQADALAVLDRTRSLLVEELGVDPGAELAATRLAVLRGERPPVAARNGSRPPPPRPAASGLSSFVGRARDVDRVRDLLGSARLVTLIGPGGAGKTRLATEAVAAAQRRCHVAALAPLTDADQLPATVLSAVGGPDLVVRATDEAGPDTTGRLLNTIGNQDIVLVLDNCEHLVGGVAALAETLVQACPRLRVLATSREPLGVPGEVLHPVEALAPADAAQLFTDRAMAVSPGFAMTAAVMPVVAEICRRLDGQPLPIELAAARLRTLSPAEIAARLDDRFRLLTSGARTALPRHQTLRAVVDWSWDLLDEPERAVARRLGVFAGGATAATAERVCAGAPGPAADGVFDLLASLVDKSLVVATPQPDGAPTRYRMLETIREYAAERLDEAGERAAAVTAHTRLAVELVEAAEPHLRGAAQLHWLTLLRAEAEEIDIALRRAVADADTDTGIRLVAGLGWSLLIRGLMDEAVRWVDSVRSLDGPAPAQSVALTTTFMALASVVRGDFTGAEEHARTAIRIATDLPKPIHPLLAMIGPVLALFARADPEPVARLSEQHADPWVRGFALQMLAQVAENDGEIEEQRRLVRAAHAEFTRTGDRFGLGMVVHSLGELEDVAANYDAAAQAFDEAIALAGELGNGDDLPQFMTRRVLLDVRRGDLDAARARLALVPTEPDGPFNTGEALYLAAAAIDRRSGDLPAARANIAVAAGLIESGGISAPQRRAYLDLARTLVELDAGATDAARAALADAVAVALQSRDGPVTAAAAEAAAQVALHTGDASCAAMLLGVATAQRGMLDVGNHEVVAALAEVRAALGRAAADAAITKAAELPRADGLVLLAEATGAALPVAAGG